MIFSNPATRSLKKKAVITISFLFSVFSLGLVIFGKPETALKFTAEDGLFENITALFYFIGFIVGIVAAFRTKPSFLLILWTVLCFIFLGEETSWFQRALGYSVPAVEQINTQNEFNLHNLILFQRGNLTESTEKTGYFFHSQNLFRIGFFGYFLIIPLLHSIPGVKPPLQKIGYKKPDTFFTLLLLLVFTSSVAVIFFLPVTLKSPLAETREMLYAYFIMIYVSVYLVSSNTEKTDP